MVQRENVRLVRALHWGYTAPKGSRSTTSRRGCQTFVTVAVLAHTTETLIDCPTAERFDKTKMDSIKALNQALHQCICVTNRVCRHGGPRTGRGLVTFPDVSQRRCGETNTPEKPS